MAKYLNLGCGNRFHPDWENVDFYPTGPGVRVLDLHDRTPYQDESFDVVYHSHLLEHFPRQTSKRFLQECYRILKPGGILRIAVPDLEQIARLYLEKLEQASKGAPGSADDYEWMILEMYDQTVREEFCGGFGEYFNRNPIPNWDFVVQRWGAFAGSAVQGIRKSTTDSQNDSSRPGTAWEYVLRNPGKVLRSKLIRLVLDRKDLKALQVGRFRQAGEVHMWMYDSYSLATLLKDVGFTDALRVGPTESRIPNWAGFHLDSEPDGRTYKADSVYMEAVKP